MRTKSSTKFLVLVAAFLGACVSKTAYEEKVKELNSALEENKQLTYEIRGVEAQARRLAQAAPGDADARAICSRWNCRKKCCRTYWGATLCEPTCYTGCEVHNLACDPNACNAIRAADPAYETFASAFRLAVQKGVIRYNDECISLAEGNAELAKLVCSACGGGIFCTPGGTFSEAEGKCVCAELKLPARPAPSPPECKDGGECKTSGECKCSCKRPKICHAECECGRCECLAD